MKKIFAILFFLSLQTAVAQNTEIKEVEKLVTNYISPLAHALGAGLNNAWWTTAKPHKKLGFDISLSITPIIIPDADKSFSIGNEGSFTGGKTATIFGGLSEGGTVNYGNHSITMPNGLGIGFIATPMLQAGIGLPPKTEINFRYSPEFKTKYFNLELMGIGVKHDLLQWIPVLNKLPIDLSVMAGHTRLNTGFDIQDQGVDLNVKATTINILLSKKVALLTAFAGIGYNHTSSNIDIRLDEQNTSFLNSINDLTNINLSELTTIEFENHTDLKANIGARLQLTLLTINASYSVTQSGYKLYTAGVGVSLR